MTKNQKIFVGIDNLVKVKKLDRDLIIEGLEEAISLAMKKSFEYDIVETKINYDSKRIVSYAYKNVVNEEDLVEPRLEISLEDAQEIKAGIKVGEELKIRLKMEKDFLERAVVQSSKQVFRQKLKEAEYKKILEHYGDKVGEIVKGNIEEIKEPYIYFKLEDDSLAVLDPRGRIEGEELNPEVPVDLIIEDIAPQSKKGPKIIVSRIGNILVEKAMRENVLEIENKDLKIKAIARDAGKRSKVAIELVNLDADIDPIGTCVGPRGSRINAIRQTLGGENIDLIEYFDDEIIFISNALAPSLVTAVQILDKENKISRVIVPDDQFSLAIGYSGQNVRLASVLTGWKIDIKSEEQAKEEGIDYSDDII